MSTDIDDQIRKERMERDQMKAAFSIKTAAYDEEFYSSGKGSEAFGTEIADDDDQPVFPVRGKKGEPKMDASKEVVRKALNSYTAPKQLLESRPRADLKTDDDDPFKEFKRKTIAEREDEYRARWRKRKLSPPRVTDPSKANDGERTYREIMMEQQLDRERHEILLKVQRDKAEEEKDRQKKLKDKNKGTLWDVKDDGSKAPKPGERESASSRPGLGSRGGTGNWVITILKNKQPAAEPINLGPTSTLKVGRDRASDITVDHASCSKAHAVIKMQADESGVNCPHVIDQSTNGTFLNGLQLQPSRPYPISDSDIVKFGASTREYLFSKD